MFLDSVVGGLSVFSYWETYVAGLEYLAIVFIPMAILGIFMETSESAGAYVGCLGMLVLPLVQLVGVAVYVLTLAPIILGIGTDAAWDLPWTVMLLAPGEFLWLVGKLILATLVLALMPIINQLESLATFALGVITLTFVLGLVNSINPGFVHEGMDILPGFWFSVGLLLVSGVVSWVGLMLPALLFSTARPYDEGLAGPVMSVFGAVFGFVPVFMYGAWLGAQLKVGS